MAKSTMEKHKSIRSLNGRFIDKDCGHDKCDCIVVPIKRPPKPIAITMAVVLGADNVPSAGSSSITLMATAMRRNLPISIAFRKPKADLSPPPAKIDRIPNRIASANSAATVTSVPANN
jgi:hypothetical protein